nr:30S ribosomal protein S9 [Candidatus Hydrogenosomobacter endosymbioticus]
MYATGKRKSAVARVWVKPGRGSFMVNGKRDFEYFGREALRFHIHRPFQQTDREGKYDVWCTVRGSGLSGQAGAVRHGISVALQLLEPSLRPALKSVGLLTRDSRRVERKKYGLRGARRKPQFSKR